MNRAFICLFAAIAALAAGVVDAQAGLLHQRTLTIDRSVNIFGSTLFDLDLELVTGSPFTSTARAVLFDAVEVAAGAAGDIFRANLASDAAFADAAARLTDNIDGLLLLVLRENASQRSELRGLSESSYFLATPAQPDLAGKRIDAIEISVDRFALSATGETTPPVDFQATISIYGVPEPSSASIVATAAFLLALSSARRFGKHS